MKRIIILFALVLLLLISVWVVLVSLSIERRCAYQKDEYYEIYVAMLNKWGDLRHNYTRAFLEALDADKEPLSLLHVYLDLIEEDGEYFIIHDKAKRYEIQFNPILLEDGSSDETTVLMYVYIKDRSEYLVVRLDRHERYICDGSSIPWLHNVYKKHD